MNVYTMIPSEFYLMRKDTLTRQLDELPVIRSGLRRTNPVLRIYDDSHKKYREISHNSSSWKRFEKIFNRRSGLEHHILRINSILAHRHERRDHSYVIVNTDNQFDNDFYDSLVDSSCTWKKESKYYYNGRNYRSRAEMIYATILDELGLEFKYDVNVTFHGKTFSVDFVIVIREFNRCVFVEYFGKCSDAGYNHDNMTKLEYAQADGVYIGRDLFIFSGDITYAPGTDLIRAQLSSIVSQLAA